MMVVIWAFNDLKSLGQDFLSALVFGQHALDCLVHDSLGILFKHRLEGELFKTTWVPSMVSVEFLLPLTPCHIWVIHVDNDAFVSILVCSLVVAGLVLASDELRYRRGDSAYWHALCIEKMVSLAIVVYGDIAALGLTRVSISVQMLSRKVG